MTYLDKAVEQIMAPVPQSQPLDSDQVANSAGGFSYKIDEFARLRRFLILGSAGGSYYAGENKLTLDNVDAVERCIAADGVETVRIINEISVGGRAPKNDQAILALALCIARGDEETRKIALSSINRVARIGTHLFQLVEFLNKLGKLNGRSKRRALADWYNSKTPDQAAYQAVKYRHRNGWTHRDVLRVAHPKAVDSEHADLFDWITKREEVIFKGHLPEIVRGFDQAQRSESPAQTAFLVKSYNLPREAVRTEHLNSEEVWQALFDVGMPVTALIRNLANMTRIGLFDNFKNVGEVEEILLGSDALLKGRVHPMTILFALKTYQSGGGYRSNKTWTPNAKIVNVLDAAFYKAFGAVEPTNKRIMLALDVSGSMSARIGETTLNCREASAAMALVTEAVESRVHIVGFTNSGSGSWKSPHRSKFASYGNWSGTDGLTPLDISSRQRLDDVVRSIERLNFGGTDCALPMLYAKEKNLEFDTFVIYTDSETWAGGVHPAKALKDYRKSSGIDAKLVVVGMTANEFSIADPKDAGMLDVVGFDTATPNIISDFACGRI